MVLKRQNLHLILNDLYEPILDDPSYNGLQVEGGESIKHISCAVSANLDTIKYCISLNSSALIVHHGLFWKGNCRLISGVFKNKIELLLSHKISLFAYHLPMDIHATCGNNYPLVKLLRGRVIEHFAEHSGRCYGIIFDINPTSIQNISNDLDTFYCSTPRSKKIVKNDVKRVAILSGAGHRYMNDLLDKNIDLFITGTSDEPNWHMAVEENINYIAYGHCVSEKIGPKKLVDFLSNKTKIPVCFIDDDNQF